jgi:hypothetical protein
MLIGHIDKQSPAQAVLTAGGAQHMVWDAGG